MNSLFTLFLFCGICISNAYGNNATFSKLAEVNKCWTEQPDISANALPFYSNQSETEWIRTHLMLVEATLRKRDTKQLSPLQQRNRLQCLDYLHQYWQTGNFPVNDVYAYCTPIFIDKYNNFCAVGYLIKASGNEHISRMIAAATNTAYVREMNYPELNTWAVENGFTTNELAWIQPGYGPTYYCATRPIGKGVDGYVNELFVDADDKLFVGGWFINVDSTIVANNIAYVTEAGGVYTWHNMGTGVNGPVHAIAKYDGKIFVAGTFDTAGGVPVNNVAYWDGAWHAAGCVSGTVYELAVYNGDLYAAGGFSDCSASASGNFAKWAGSNWLHIPGITGRINTMEATSSSLVLGGAFSYDTIYNVAQWSPATSFQQFSNYLRNEVMDFEMHNDSLYAVCKRTDTVDTANVFVVLRANSWQWVGFHMIYPDDFYPSNGVLSLNTLCHSSSTSLEAGGQFHYIYPVVPGPGQGYNSFSTGNCMPRTDSVINKMVVYKGKLVFGGKFKKGYPDANLNGIFWREWVWVDVPVVKVNRKEIRIYPNPIESGNVLSLENNMNATHYTLHHITGRQVASGDISNTNTVSLPQVPPGIYFISLTNAAGEKSIQKLQID